MLVKIGDDWGNPDANGGLMNNVYRLPADQVAAEINRQTDGGSK
jgi:hypothetical protein